MAGRVARRDVAAGAAVVAAVLSVSYWKVVNAETFMRLAIGRFTVEAGLLAERDPWIYAVPALRWRNPEWLGDLLLYGAWQVGGESGLVALKLVILVCGWLLLYALARRTGGTPLTVLALIALALAGSSGRFVERNDLHAYWLIPATGLALQASARDRRWLFALPLLGWLWPSLHGSFPLGWLVIGAALAAAIAGPGRDGRRARDLALVLAVHPLLPFLGPDGFRAYDLMLDAVVKHGAEIKTIIKEWIPPGELPATLAGLPLHVLGLLGLASFLPRPNRGQVAGFLLVTAGLVMAHRTLRFFLLFAMLSIPVVSANLHRAGQALAEARARWRAIGAGVLLVGALALLVPAAIAARQPGRAAENRTYPVRAARWLAQKAPPGSRLFGPYTGSQWLMWEAPAVGLYIHPHFSFGSEHLLRYVRQILPHPAAFDAEVARLEINLALVGAADESAQLVAHLAGSPAWKRVYGDGAFAIFARRIPINAALLGP